MFFKLPNFPFRTPTKSWRIHDNGIVSIVATNFPRHKTLSIIYNPANLLIGKARQLKILTTPSDYRFASVAVRHVSIN